MSEAPYYIGVDVGTGSVRAGLVDKQGHLVNSASHSIDILEPQQGLYEQSSDNIWHGCCQVVRSVTQSVQPADIHGVGFDATCSLVALDTDFKPVTVSPSGLSQWNVLMWMDHRAAEQASRINATHHPVLKYVGGTISLEMQTPKLLWLKENLKESCWDKVGHFFDLPDFLTWRATGSLTRSLCSLVCKWTYGVDGEGHQGWDSTFFQQIGLQDLIQDDFVKIGKDVLTPGQPCGQGLTEQAANDLGLKPGTPVATSIIDAHAGGLGSIGCSAKGHNLDPSNPVTSRMALIFGTSTCHMAVSHEALFVPGVWGPYYSAMVPGLFLNEGGQSAAGKLIDHVIDTHIAKPWVIEEAKNSSKHVHVVLNDILLHMVKRDDIPSVAKVTQCLHVWPDYHGNRSPLADPSLKGMVSGLTLASGAEDLASKYLATVQALAYGTRHIVESLNKHGHTIGVLCVSGGLCKNPLYLQIHADVTGLPILIPDNSEPVLLGAAILAACASQGFPSIQDAMSHMSGKGKVILPNLQDKEYHDKKYTVFRLMVQHQQQYAQIMTG